MKFFDRATDTQVEAVLSQARTVTLDSTVGMIEASQRQPADDLGFDHSWAPGYVGFYRSVQSLSNSCGRSS